MSRNNKSIYKEFIENVGTDVEIPNMSPFSLSAGSRSQSSGLRSRSRFPVQNIMSGSFSNGNTTVTFMHGSGPMSMPNIFESMLSDSDPNDYDPPPRVTPEKAKEMQVIDKPDEKFETGPFNKEHSSHKSCMACCDNRVDYITTPCGHFTYCGDCQPKIRDDRCPIFKCENIKYQRIRWT